MATLSSIITPTNILTESSTDTLTNKTINGSNNTLSNVSLTTAVTGTLPIANGGTGLTAVGSNGQVLASTGSGLNFVTPSAGAMTLISTQTASAASSIDFTGLSTYNQYMIVLQNLIPSGLEQLYMRVGTGGGPTYLTSGYLQSGIYTDSFGTNPAVFDANNAAQFNLAAGNNQPTAAVQGTSGFATISGCVSNYLEITGQISVANSAGRNGAYSFAGLQNASQTITAIRVLFSGGTITGKVSLYGISS
jgi:hypothetical protein